MKKLLIIIVATLILSGCADKRPQPNSLINDQSANQTAPTTNTSQEKQTVNFTTNYLPSGWVIENNFFYSPEMYNAREGGPYSLHITINNKFSSINDYLNSKANCIKDKTELNINNNPAIRFIDSCAYAKPKMTIFQKDENLVEAFSYSFSNESKEIEQILKTLEIKK